MPRDKPPHPLFTPASPLPWLLLVPLALIFLPEASRITLQLEYDGLMNGEIYRLWTGHLVHLSPLHAVLNAAALLGICLLCRQSTLAALTWPVVLLLPATVGCALLFLPPGYDWYVGLSGLLHGIAFWLALAGFNNADRPAVALGIVVLVKIAAEALFGSNPGWEALLGGPVLVVAHAWGVLAAGLGFLALRGFAAHQHTV